MKMKLYVYKTETKKIVEIIDGEQAEIEAQAERQYDTDVYAWTYSPAIGTADGLCW
jgi:hypothetical protein